MSKEKTKKQDLGIFYTPEPVVEFIFKILKILKDKQDKEEKRWQSRKPRPHYPSVIDPACGEGIFLKKAVESGFTGENPSFKAPYIWGIDIDKDVVNRWEEISVLHLFHRDRKRMQDHFYHQNGLLPLEDKPLIYKKKEDGLKRYDAVVGNPPYGGTGLKDNDIKGELGKALFEFEIWKYSFDKQKLGQASLLDEPPIEGKIQAKIKKYPIEILFLERFLQLCKPKGWIAIIVPDGILANSTLHYVRRFIAERTRVLGIISLPRDTFKQAGTSAKTSILFLEKRGKPSLSEENWDYPVFIASVKEVKSQWFDIIVDNYRSFVEKGKL